MSLLDLYLKAVGVHLPKGSDRADILAELRVHLETKMDERRAALGHALTETEQQAVLAEFGEPFVVATRYGKLGRGFAFGPFQLISPAAFPIYVGVLLFALAVNVIVALVELALTDAPLWGLAQRVASTMLVLFVVITLVYAGVDFFLRRSSRTQRGAPESWLFYTPYLKYVPKWYSGAGLASMGAIALVWGLWWNVWPAVPALLLGPAVEPLELTPAWQRLQLALLVLLLVGVAQRAFSLARPDLNWVPWAVRLGINLGCLALLFPILDSAAFVVAPDVAAAGVDAIALAERINNATYGLLRGCGIYWALNTLWIGFVFAGHVVYRVRTRRSIDVPPTSLSRDGSDVRPS